MEYVLLAVAAVSIIYIPFGMYRFGYNKGKEEGYKKGYNEGARDGYRVLSVNK